jgi:hypothetical protein
MPIGFLTVYPCLLQGSVVIAIATWLGNGYLAWYILMISRIADKALAKNGVYTRPVTGLPEPGRGASFPFSEPFFFVHFLRIFCFRVKSYIQYLGCTKQRQPRMVSESGGHLFRRKTANISCTWPRTCVTIVRFPSKAQTLYSTKSASQLAQEAAHRREMDKIIGYVTWIMLKTPFLLPNSEWRKNR